MDDFFYDEFDVEDSLDVDDSFVDYNIPTDDEFHPTFGKHLSDYEHEQVIQHSNNIIDDFRQLSHTSNANESQRIIDDIRRESELRDWAQRSESFNKQHELSQELKMLQIQQWGEIFKK